MNDIGIVTRGSLLIHCDPTRVVTHLFIAGQELTGGSESRTSDTVARVLSLDEHVVDEVLAELYKDFSHRHADLPAVFEENALRVSSFVSTEITKNRRQLLGASFTHEFSLEGAAVCNPSIVVHPDQKGVAKNGLRFVMSFRAIGEGHRSTICFRTGEIDGTGVLSVHDARDFPVLGKSSPGILNRDTFHAQLRDLGLDGETASAMLDSLPVQFTREQLDDSIAKVILEDGVRINLGETSLMLRLLTEAFYVSSFSTDTTLCQRVLWPASPVESQGMEDARFVEVDDDECARYIATYTAYDGKVVSQQLLETDDFLTFHSSPLAGMAARNKGLAFFPRKIRGRYVALSRFDREKNSLAFSSDLHQWDEVVTLESPEQPWEMLQLGNCGSPIELDEGWLVLTHGVGPMRTYGIGALLLHLEDPTKVLGKLKVPLLVPSSDEREGYTPNVVYSCGSLVHNGTLYLPFGAADESIRCAQVKVEELVTLLVS